KPLGSFAIAFVRPYCMSLWLVCWAKAAYCGARRNLCGRQEAQQTPCQPHRSCGPESGQAVITLGEIRVEDDAALTSCCGMPHGGCESARPAPRTRDGRRPRYWPNDPTIGFAIHMPRYLAEFDWR